MIRFLLKKAASLSLSLFLVATLTFVLMKAIPGDPFTDERAIPEEIMRSLYKHYGLDQPLYIQYGRYLKGLVTWNLGPSYKYEGRTVNEIINEGFPVSLCIGLEALAVALCAGVTLGTIAAVRRGKWQDHLMMIIAVLGISVPSFVLATFLQYLLAIKLELFPVARWGTFIQTVLPALSLAGLPTAFIARLTRTNMVEVLEQDYILTAKAKGLSTFQIIRRHVLRNALLPVVTYLGPLTAMVITGSFVVEKLFGIPGLGQWFINSISNRDYTVIMGTTVFWSTLLLSCVFLVDIAYGFMDPRLKKVSRND